MISRAPKKLNPIEKRQLNGICDSWA